MKSLLDRLDPSGIDLKTRIVSLLYQNPFLEPALPELEMRFGVKSSALEPALADLVNAGVVNEVKTTDAPGASVFRFEPNERVLEEIVDLAQAHLHDQNEVRQRVVELETLSRLRDRLAVTRKEVVAILEMAPSGILLLDPFGHLLKCNRQAQELLSLSTHSGDPDVCGLLGMDLAEVLQREMRMEVDRQPPLEVRSRPFRVSGSDTGAMITVEDISRRRELEEETASLRESFFSMIRHELRRPLLTVQRYLGARGKGNGSRSSGLREARTAADQLASMVDDMLFLARLERDPMVVEPEERVSIRHLIAANHLTYREVAERSRIELVAELPDDISVNGDERRLFQVVGNLMDNAIKFTPEGGTVRISGGAEGGMARVTVEDSGPGIPDDEQSRVLETFYQIRNDDARVAGLGLGLAICRRVVEAHGGTMYVGESDLGGASVEVRLPDGS